MATFFARRYMRKLEWVSRTEIGLGALVILLLVAILAAFGIVVRTDRNYLFDIDPGAQIDNIPSHGLAVAQRMLPALPASPWPEAGELEVFGFETLAEALQDDAHSYTAFEVRAVYRRRYTAKDKPGNELTVLVSDASTPAQAFGLCNARAGEFGPVFTDTMGPACWRSPGLGRAGFWKGRYYTELTLAQAGSDADPILKTSAAVFAERQLDYGGAFWAEALLPAEPALTNFTYVHRNAFGIDDLNEVFAVDLDSRVTAWVHDAGSASDAIDLIRLVAATAGTAPKGAGEYGYDAAEAGQSTAVRYDGPLTIVPFKGGEMALFTSGPYAFGVFGWGLDLAGLAKQHYQKVSALTAASPAGVQTIPTFVASADAGATFPDIDVAGWKPPRKVSHFTPQTLYEKINGRADAYLQYKVVGMDFGTYFHTSDRSRTIDVYWYDMGESVNAFGIYQLEAPPDLASVSIGDAGYETGGAVFFRKGGSYLQILPAGSGPIDSDLALAIARRIADRIKAEDGDLWAQDALPEAGRVPDSFSFVAQDAFGLDFLSDVFTAAYNHASGRMTLFIHRADNEASARNLLDKYRGFMEKYGNVLPAGTDDADAFLAGEVAGLIDVVFVKGRYLGGVTGAKDSAAAQELCRDFYDGLKVP